MRTPRGAPRSHGRMILGGLDEVVNRGAEVVWRVARPHPHLLPWGRGGGAGCVQEGEVQRRDCLLHPQQRVLTLEGSGFRVQGSRFRFRVQSGGRQKRVRIRQLRQGGGGCSPGGGPGQGASRGGHWSPFRAGRPPATRSSKVNLLVIKSQLSSKVNFIHAINFRAACARLGFMTVRFTNRFGRNKNLLNGTPVEKPCVDGNIGASYEKGFSRCQAKWQHIGQPGAGYR